MKQAWQKSSRRVLSPFWAVVPVSIVLAIFLFLMLQISASYKRGYEQGKIDAVKSASQSNNSH